MELPTEIFGDVMVIHTPEEFANDQAEDIRDYLVSQERSNVVIDIDGSETIDSRGLTAILDAHDELLSLGGGLKVTTTNSVNQKLLEITRLDQHVEAYESVLDAVKSFQ